MSAGPIWSPYNFELFSPVTYHLYKNPVHIADIEFNGSKFGVLSIFFLSRRAIFFLLGYGRVPNAKLLVFA